jgi:hypothetical protein
MLSYTLIMNNAHQFILNVSPKTFYHFIPSLIWETSHVLVILDVRTYNLANFLCYFKIVMTLQLLLADFLVTSLTFYYLTYCFDKKFADFLYINDFLSFADLLYNLYTFYMLMTSIFCNLAEFPYVVLSFLRRCTV